MRTNEDWQSLFGRAAENVGSAPSYPPAIKTLNASIVAKTIDHTLLKLDATEDQITTLCNEALTYNLGAVCVRLQFIPHAHSHLAGSAVKLACVIGFHEGTYSTAEKLAESKAAVAAGSNELDVVLNRETLRSGDFAGVFEELSGIRSVVDQTCGEVGGPEVVLKLILETSQLSEEEVLRAGVLAYFAGFDFLKTSTGFCGRGCSLEDVVLMGKIAGVLEEWEDDVGMGVRCGQRRMKIKASGGVRSLEDVKKMIEAGAVRIGTSSGVGIMKEVLGEAVGDGGGDVRSAY